MELWCWIREGGWQNGEDDQRKMISLPEMTGMQCVGLPFPVPHMYTAQYFVCIHGCSFIQ